MKLSRAQMIAALNYIIGKGAPFSDVVALAKDYQAESGCSVADLLVNSEAPSFGCAVIDTWNGGQGGRLGRFTSDKSGVEAFNDCFEWIQKNTPFSFHEATTNQGLEIEYFVEGHGTLCETCGVRDCEDEHDPDDLSWITPEMFDEKLSEMAHRSSVAEILALPGVLEICCEELNNEVIAEIQDEHGR